MIELKAGALRCEIEPRLGGCIAGLWLGELPVLRSRPAAALTSVRDSASYPLVPFSNRIAQATLQWNGTRHPLVRNFSPEPHAIHGVGWQRAWEVLEAGEAYALLSFEHRGDDAAWPFAFDSSQALRLRPGALEVTLSMTNQSPGPAPAGLGWHPYFVKRARSRIAFEAAGRWEMDSGKLPTARSPMPGLDTDCASLDVDHCFDGWRGVVQLRDELLHTRITSNLGCLVVYTAPAKDFIAIEPVSHVNNAINLVAAGWDADALGLKVLQPGESMSVQMTIEMEHAP